MVDFLFYFLNSILEKPNFSKLQKRKHLLKVTAEHFICPAFPSCPVSRVLIPLALSDQCLDSMPRRLTGLLATKLMSLQIYLQKLDESGCW